MQDVEKMKATRKYLETGTLSIDQVLQVLKAKQREYEQEATYIEDIQRLVTEIEMLKFVLFLISRKDKEKEKSEWGEKRRKSLQFF